MNETIYYLAYDDGNMVIKDVPNKLLERFDKEKKEWVEDEELCRIYFGSILTKVISSGEAYILTEGHL